MGLQGCYWSYVARQLYSFDWIKRAWFEYLHLFLESWINFIMCFKFGIIVINQLIAVATYNFEKTNHVAK